MQKKKQGISLITLVITIIIMIILAGVVILSLSNTNIFDKANEAIDEYNLKQVQSLATLKWLDAYYDKDINTEEEYEDYIREALENEGVNTKIYDIEADETHVTITPKLDLDSIVANEELNGTTEIGGIKYTITKGVASVTGYTDKLPNEVVIPAVITYENTLCRVMSVGNSAFMKNTNITSVIIEEGVTSIGYETFKGCTSLTIAIPHGVISIGMNAFDNCSSLITINLSDSLTTIRTSAFANCTSLQTIEIPNSVTSIGSSVFSGCIKLTEINVNDNNSTYASREGVLYNKSLTEIIRCPEGKSGSYIIPEGVTSIGHDAFMSCEKLTEIAISDGVTSIGTAAFYSCDKLTKITLPSSLTSIGSYAFEYCNSLSTIDIPASVTSIGYWAFEGCSGLTNINVDVNNLTYFSDEGVLYNKEVTELIVCPGGKSGSYTILDGTQSINDYAFRYCRRLSKVEMPDSITSIGRAAFDSCYVLSTVEISNNLTSISQYAFYSCRSLTAINIPDSVKSIENDAFYGCNSLTAINIPANVTSIGNTAFSGCSNLADIYYGGSEWTFNCELPTNCQIHTDSTWPA